MSIKVHAIFLEATVVAFSSKISAARFRQEMQVLGTLCAESAGPETRIGRVVFFGRSLLSRKNKGSRPKKGTACHVSI